MTLSERLAAMERRVAELEGQEDTPTKYSIADMHRRLAKLEGFVGVPDEEESEDDPEDDEQPDDRTDYYVVVAQAPKGKWHYLSGVYGRTREWSQSKDLAAQFSSRDRAASSIPWPTLPAGYTKTSIIGITR